MAKGDRRGPARIGRPMFRKIAVRNFKSLANTSTELGPFTVLVGNNGAGKSSFLQAIELASWTVKYDSINDALLANRINFRDLVYLRAAHSKIFLAAELATPSPNGANGSAAVSVEMVLAKRRYVYIDVEIVKPAGCPELSAAPYGIASAKRGRSAWEGADKATRRVIRHENVALGHSMLRDVYLSKAASKDFPVLYQVARHYMGYVHYEIWGPENLRDPSHPRKTVWHYAAGTNGLGKRGEELPTLLSRIRENEVRWQELLSELQEAYPGIRQIQIKRGLEAGELGLLFAERPGPHSPLLLYRPSQMSDGFLRLLALLAIKHQPEPLALLGYEEPENGLHPSALDDCMRHLKGIAGKGTQVIVTTHSPYLLNHLLEDEAEPRAELRLVWRDKQGRTTIAKPDPDKVERARRQGFGIGELWGMLLNEKELAQT